MASIEKEELSVTYIEKILSGYRITEPLTNVVKVNTTYTISNKVIKDPVRFNKSSVLNLIFIDCIFEQSVTFEDPACKISFATNRCQFNTIIFQEGNYSNSIEIHGVVSSSVHLNGGVYDRIEIDC